MANVLLVVGNAGAMGADDTELEAILEARGHTVTVVSDETAEDVTGIDFVVINSSVDEGQISTKYATISQPLWMADMFVAVDKLMCSGTPISEAPVIRVNSAQNGHVGLGGLNSSSNPITVATSGNVRELNGTLASGAVLLADGNDAGFPAYWYVPEGAALTAGNSPNLRVVFEPISTAALPNFNASGDALIDGILDLIESELTVTSQSRFRWGSDDGSESAHGWAAAEDTNLTLEVSNTRLLRVQADTSGDLSATAFTLRYQKNGSGGYAAVPVGATTDFPPVMESGDATVTTVGAAADPWAINVPAAVAGDLLIFVLAWDDSTNVTTVTAPAGQNAETISSIVGPVASASTEMRMQAWYTVCTGTWGAGTISFDPSAAETVRAVVIKVPAGEFDSVTPIGASSSSASAGTTESSLTSPAFSAGASDGGGTLLLCYGSDADAITPPASGTGTVNNATGGGVGLDIETRDAAVTDSESIASITATIASDSWACLAFVVRGITVTNEVYVVASGNIAASGEATTARLTAPSGKTTSDFTTGRRWDDENGTDTTDIAADFYSEFEWPIRIVPPGAAGDYYEFRLYAGSSAFVTYDVTPRWTLAGAGVSLDIVRGDPVRTQRTQFTLRRMAAMPLDVGPKVPTPFAPLRAETTPPSRRTRFALQAIPVLLEYPPGTPPSPVEFVPLLAQRNVRHTGRH